MPDPAAGTRLEAMLREAGVPFEILDHGDARTAREAAEARGTPLGIGGKSLVFKVDRDLGFAVLALPGNREVDNLMLRRRLGIRRYRFARSDELLALTGLTPGSIPPFGRPLFEARLYVDTHLAESERIAFSPGSHTRSILMRTADWLYVARPDDVFAFTRSGDGAPGLASTS